MELFLSMSEPGQGFVHCCMPSTEPGAHLLRSVPAPCVSSQLPWRVCAHAVTRGPISALLTWINPALLSRLRSRVTAVEGVTG